MEFDTVAFLHTVSAGIVRRKSRGEYYTVSAQLPNGQLVERGNFATLTECVRAVIDRPQDFPESEQKILLKKT